MKHYSPYQFALFRFLLGLGFFFYFLLVLPYAPDLTNTNSIGINLDQLYIPSIFIWIQSIASVKFFMISLATVSALISLGVARRLLASIVLMGFASTIHMLPFVPSPRDGFAFFALWIAILAPHGESCTLYPMHLSPIAWRIHRWLPFAMRWILTISIVLFGGINVQRALLVQQFGIAMVSLGYFICGILLLRRRWRLIAWFLVTLLFIFYPATMNLGLYFVGFAALVFAIEQDLVLPWALKNQRASEVYIDGECVLCNGIAEFILHEDTKKIFRIASLQGNHARSFLPERFRTELSTVVLQDSDHTFTKSSAVLRIIGRLGGFWTIAYLLLLIPAPVRDLVYGLIARFRYRVFGKYNECRLPTPAERDRILN